MNIDKFGELLERRIKLMRETLEAKNKEYGSGADRLHNFKRAADMLQTTPEEALIGMWTKHIISILDIVDKTTKQNKKSGLSFITNPEFLGVSKEMIDEKIGDAINYLILLEALLKERMNYGKIY